MAASAAADDFEGKAIGDTVRYVVAYDMKSVVDNMSGGWAHYTEPMRLEIGDKTARFYSYAAFRDDSLNSIRWERGERRAYFSRKVCWELYKNYPTAGKTALLERFGMDRFVCTEDYAAPLWQPVADSSAVILGYQCSMAVTNYKGRTWYAWYAEDIPLDAGPWKLGGLPGLILRAYDAPRHYVFDAVGMSEVATPTPI